MRSTSGSVECAHTPTYFYFGKDPTLGFGTGLPFGLNSRHQQAWWAFGGGAEIVNASLRKLNAYGIPAGNSGTQMGGWFRKEINTVDDLKGLKFRIGGMGGQVLARLGVVPQQIAPGDVYSALERGTIDAAEFVGPYDDEKLGLAKVAKNYYYPGWWEGGAMLHLVHQPGADGMRCPSTTRRSCAQACDAANTLDARQVRCGQCARAQAPGRRRRGAEAVPAAGAGGLLQGGQRALRRDRRQGRRTSRRRWNSVNAFRREQLPWWQIAEHAFDSFMIGTRSRA